MLRFTLFFIFIILAEDISSQNIPISSDQLREDFYSSLENKMYWKNRKPYADYWQQDVHYKIYAELNEEKRVVYGKEELVYLNNSPDTLTEVFFHLYQNAFQPGSYHHDLYTENKIPVKFGEYEKQGLNTVVKNVYAEENSNRQVLHTKLNNTILQVKLSKPLLPGAKMKFYLEFETYFDKGDMRRRMKSFEHNGDKHFDGVHWYPRISVYDKQRRWNTDQHLNRELYGDYGTFEVHLTLPSHYIAEATGNLMNEGDVLPKDLREKLDLKNFSSKKPGEKASVIIAPDGKTKTWVYQAFNVHDFAWTADPTYRIGETSWNGIKVIAIAQEDNAAGWQKVPALTAQVIATYSQDFGMYAWPKIVVADARDGMEYNMLTLCGGTYPSNTSLIAHEVGHMWFYGIIGSNETYRAFLDEGFTQFLTVWFLEKNTKPQLSNIKYFTGNQPIISSYDSRLMYSYLRSTDDVDQRTLNTHSDDFHGQIGHGGGYGQVYYKTGVMLYNLQYVLGDSLFEGAMKYYYNKWKFCHPYPEDFRNAITEYTKTDLSWLFDQWLETNKTIDYAIKSVKKAGDGYDIVFERKGEMQMPLDFTVELKSGEKKHYHIPNTYFIKKTNAQVLETWTGWGEKVRPNYTAHISTTEKILNVYIDTSNRLADVNMLNNSYKDKVDFKYDNDFSGYPDRYKYKLLWRPDIWYNAVDGLKTGIHFEGDYFKRDHFIWATIWYNTQVFAYDRQPKNALIPDHINYNLRYSNSLRKIDNNLSWGIELRALDGLQMEKIGITKLFKNNHSINLNYKQMIRRNQRNLAYLIYPEEWNADKLNSTVNLEWSKPFSHLKTNGKFNILLRTSAPGSDYQYANLNGQITHSTNLSKSVQWRFREAAFYTSGTNVAPESQLYLAGGNPEEMMESRLLRSRTIVPDAAIGFGENIKHLHFGGGLNLRGYSGYLAPVLQDDSIQNSYKGFSGFAFNTELDFSRQNTFHTIRKRGNLQTSIGYSFYAFFDAGIISTNLSKTEFLPVRMDAGLGTAVTINNLAGRRNPPIIIRFESPFYISHAPANDPQNIKFRWIIGLGRAF